ncbi:hypothetical protein M0802_015772 [Mischocyttarus mexicanus]|nr:hypothetical protein M0802_015772 [Mischocyttarus mexicanus]
MTGKKKSGRGGGGRKGRKQETKIIDEYQLRRDLRERKDSLDMDEQTTVMIDDKISENDQKLLDNVSREIRIGGIEG